MRIRHKLCSRRGVQKHIFTKIAFFLFFILKVGTGHEAKFKCENAGENVEHEEIYRVSAMII